MASLLPPLNALRAFEAAARHLSFTRAAMELNVTAGALSHQIRSLEDFLDVRLFERQARGVALTQQGKALYPGLQVGFGLLRDAVASMRATTDNQILVVSTPPGFTSKWLAARLYRFAEKNPDIELRIASSVAYANFKTDGVDVAIRNVSHAHTDNGDLIHEKLFDVDLILVCSPKLIARIGPLDTADSIAQAPLIHDDQLCGHSKVPNWDNWAKAAGIEVGERGLHFSSADHALDAAVEGAGVLLTHAILAYDDLRRGRLVMPIKFTVPSGRAYYFVYPKAKQTQRNVQGFRSWLHSETRSLQTVNPL